jgi:hypothetical protein
MSVQLLVEEGQMAPDSIRAMVLYQDIIAQ